MKRWIEMDDIETQVVQCLSAVFPDLDPQALHGLSQATHPGWDSVAHVTMIAALGEAFDTDFDFEAFAEATSFERLVDQVRQQLGRG
jgi:acyl carrier protein